jgi:hypothetical protein
MRHGCNILAIACVALVAACGSASPKPTSPTRDTGTGTAAANAAVSEMPKVRGPLSPEVVHQVVRWNLEGMDECFHDGRTRNPNLGGKISVRFVIEVDGRVSSAKDVHDVLASEDIRSEQAERRFPDAKVVDCVVARFENLQFPPPREATVTVVYPVVFVPTDTSPEADAPPSDPPEPTMPHMRKASVDIGGVMFKDVECSSSFGYGVLAGPDTPPEDPDIIWAKAALGGIASKRREIAACLRQRESRVEWVAAQGHMSKIEPNAADAATKKCLVRALNNADTEFEGTCTATVSIGKPTKKR